MKFVEREENVARDNEFRVPIALRRQRGERIIARQMCVDNLYLMLAHETREFQCACDVERVAKTQGENILRGQRIDFFTKR